MGRKKIDALKTSSAYIKKKAHQLFLKFIPRPVRNEEGSGYWYGDIDYRIKVAVNGGS
jgi:hypothetical protein